MSPPSVPAHLRRFVVQQDYAQYDAVDQAVWRFVLLQTHARLVETAHPAYRDGLAATGISVERIPSIDEMNERLGRFGWGAVCVDGFIPPRAFQEFQSLGILPIAADMRSREHLVYTPAPDIIHEAAGHAPILPDPVYSDYLRRIGEIGRQAFTVPEEARVDRAIRALSEVKEDPAATPADVAAAQTELEAAIAAVPAPSEAAKISRLYWWTAEYGLVGDVRDYRLYGAGLLSSLGESVSCHDPSVRKIPLDERCVEVAYDITRPQPQLFVARDFGALHDVLARVAGTLAAARGGEIALERALASAEPAALRFSSGLVVTAVLAGVGPSLTAPSWLELAGRVAVGDGSLGDVFANGERALVLTGTLAGGARLEELSDARLEELAVDRRTRLRFASGATVDGRLTRAVRRSDGRLAFVVLEDARASAPGATPRSAASLAVLAGGDFMTAHAGALPDDGAPDAADPVRVPRPRRLSPVAVALLGLYERAERAHLRGPASVARHYPAIHRALERRFPDEWLLRWNLLESLLKARARGPLAAALRAELEELEVRFDYRQPIASGLRYLTRLAA
jgi:phenylalanine-4-hydroxylase